MKWLAFLVLVLAGCKSDKPNKDVIGMTEAQAYGSNISHRADMNCMTNAPRK